MSPDDEVVDELNATPHILVSSQLRPLTDVARLKAAEDLEDVLGLDKIDALTLALASANPTQLKQAARQVRVKRVGMHQFTYIEVDIVTWRILPSPENIRFEDQRTGIGNVYRYMSVPELPATLLLDVEDTAQLIDQLERQTTDIMRENPHAATIPVRGIEVPGLLSLARAELEDRNLTVGYLDATDGFGRTAGAHSGLGITPRDVLLRFSMPDDEAKFRRELIRLRDSSPDGSALSEEQRRKLRSSVMARAQVIVGYELIDAQAGLAISPAYDRARRTLVGHIHMAPPHPFTHAAQWAAKANAIREGLLVADQLPTSAGLDRETAFELLSGNADLLDDANLLIDEYAVVVLEAFRPLLTTKRGKAVQAAVQDLTGQRVSAGDLAMIAAEVALRPVLQRRELTSVQAESTLESLRSILGRAWDSSIFAGVQYSGRSIPDLVAESIEEYRFQMANTDKDIRAPKAARSELAALASFDMVAFDRGPLLQRAVGRKNAGVNMAEPNQVMQWMYRSEHGIQQMAQIVLDVRGQRTPQLLTESTPSENKTLNGAEIATAETIREAHRPASGSVQSPAASMPATPQEQLNRALLYLNDTVSNLVASVDAAAAIRGDVGTRSNVSLVEEEGAVVRDEISKIMNISVTLGGWQRTSENLAQARRDFADHTAADDDDPLD